MAESRANRMQLVLKLAEKAEDVAAKKLQEQAELVRQEQAQLQDLNDYSTQYLQSYPGVNKPVTAREMMNYSGFISRLADAIKEQEIKIQRMQQGLDKLKSQWSVAHQKRKSLEELIERYQKEESLLLDKQLQKELDELANRPNGLC